MAESLEVYGRESLKTQLFRKTILKKYVLLYVKLDIKKQEEVEAVDALVRLEWDFELEVEAIELPVPVPVWFVTLK